MFLARIRKYQLSFLRIRRDHLLKPPVPVGLSVEPGAIDVDVVRLSGPWLVIVQKPDPQLAHVALELEAVALVGFASLELRLLLRDMDDVARIENIGILAFLFH